MFKLTQALKSFALPFLVATSVYTTSSERANDRAQCVVNAAPILNFTSSQWIWTTELTRPNGIAPVGSRAFRRTFLSPQGKTPSFLTIGFASANAATLWVNGNPIVTQAGWLTAGRYCVNLEICNCGLLIAFNATNSISSAGLLVDAQVTYTDGSTSSIVSDSSWRTTTGGILSGFQQSTLNDSAWEAAETQGRNGVAPWGRVQRAGADPQSLGVSWWIWTNEQSPGLYPPSARAFRYTITLPVGHTSGTATVMIVVDNQYSLYINGRFIGTGQNYRTAQKFVAAVQGPKVVFAVYGQNTNVVPNPAGLLVSIQVISESQDTLSFCTNCNSTTYVISDKSWKAFSGLVPSGFEQPGFDDSAWPCKRAVYRHSICTY
ncbi:hypothetical protein D9757_010402 [Collybiopsis confluens]|uniref:Lectin n=1 Tax=Collybiopsis confluens TaxID=2823264 RepID=A0A8H5GPC3_9AGAR|nr:hypothetical protein D9757_013229 [Collybiopsis confluens]KAF5368734.1 hypothetical protein D9757_010402 [Collybiopsis confluens]